MTTIVVPVFNAPAALERCLAALRSTVSRGQRVILIDDASTDPAVESIMKSVPAGWEVVRQAENRGFVVTANLGLELAATDDVLLLNSDTVPAGDWVSRIEACAASDERIASVTPFTNNGEIVSLPDFCRGNPLPRDVERWALACRQAGLPEYPELPTAVGFCMWLRREAISDIGGFDAETFGYGYGEENDWSMRALKSGWRNVLCDDAFVGHEGNQSFGPQGMSPGGTAMERVLERHPDYLRRVEAFIAADPLAGRRARILREYGRMA